MEWPIILIIILVCAYGIVVFLAFIQCLLKTCEERKRKLEIAKAARTTIPLETVTRAENMDFSIRSIRPPPLVNLRTLQPIPPMYPLRPVPTLSTQPSLPSFRTISTLQTIKSDSDLPTYEKATKN